MGMIQAYIYYATTDVTGGRAQVVKRWGWRRKVKVKVAQLCLTLCDSMDYTDHGILQARILEWVAFPFSRASSQPRDQTHVSHIAGRFFPSIRGFSNESALCIRYWSFSFSISPSNEYSGLISFRMDFPCGSFVKKPPAMQKTWVQSLGWEDALEKGKVTHSSILT